MAARYSWAFPLLLTSGSDSAPDDTQLPMPGAVAKPTFTIATGVAGGGGATAAGGPLVSPPACDRFQAVPLRTGRIRNKRQANPPGAGLPLIQDSNRPPGLAYVGYDSVENAI